MRRDGAEWVEPRGPIRGVQVEGGPSRGVLMRGGRAEEDQCEGGRTEGGTEGAEELSGRGPEGPRTGAAEDWTGGAEDRRSRGGVDRSSWPIAGDRRASSAGAAAHRTEWPNVGGAEVSEWAEQIPKLATTEGDERRNWPDMHQGGKDWSGSESERPTTAATEDRSGRGPERPRTTVAEDRSGGRPQRMGRAECTEPRYCCTCG